MNIIKLLAIIILIIVAYRLLVTRKPKSRTPLRNHRETLVICHQCGSHVPLSTTIKDNAGNYLCEEHRNYTQ